MKKDWKENIYFVLVEPEEPGNVGAAARALKNMGFKNLRLVNPPPLDKEARWFAHLALDVLDSAAICKSLKEAIQDMSLVVGTTRRKGKKREVIFDLDEGMKRTFEYSHNNRIAILFGMEKKGLSNEEVEECGLLISIPASREHPSLNLSHAVMLVAYELSEAGRREAAGTKPSLVSHGELDMLYQKVSQTLGLLDYRPQGSRDIEKNILATLKHLAGRAGLTARELKTLYGLCYRVESRLGEPKV